MDRRAFLVVLAAISSLTYGGWLYKTYPATVYVEGDIFIDERHGNGILEWQEQYSTVISDETTAETVLTDADPPASFVAATDFADSYLVIIQTGAQSAAELTLDTLDWADDHLHVEASIEYPDGPQGDDLVTHSLLIRITDEELPEEVSITIDGYI